MKAIEKARLKLLCNRFIRSLRFIIHLSINLFLISKEYFQQKFPSLTILFLHVTKPKKERKYAWMNWWRKKKEKMEGARFRPVSSRFIGWIGCPFGASLLYAARENVSLVNGRSTRHVARAIGSEKHLWKRASPFTSEATDYLIPSGRAQGEKMTVCEWPRSLPLALSLSLSPSRFRKTPIDDLVSLPPP